MAQAAKGIEGATIRWCPNDQRGARRFEGGAVADQAMGMNACINPDVGA
jgi:hypothetical protein